MSNQNDAVEREPECCMCDGSDPTGNGLLCWDHFVDHIPADARTYPLPDMLGLNAARIVEPGVMPDPVTLARLLNAASGVRSDGDAALMAWAAVTILELLHTAPERPDALREAEDFLLRDALKAGIFKWDNVWQKGLSPASIFALVSHITDELRALRSTHSAAPVPELHIGEYYLFEVSLFTGNPAHRVIGKWHGNGIFSSVSYSEAMTIITYDIPMFRVIQHIPMRPESTL